jgi:diaminopimelate decarboxylase
VSLRVNPDIDPRSHPYISTGLRENKFGIDIALAEEVLGRARSVRGVRVVGVQSHIGSQITDLGPIVEAVRELAALSRRLLDQGFALETIDIGGGLGVDYAGTGAPSPEALAAQVLPELRGCPSPCCGARPVAGGPRGRSAHARPRREAEPRPYLRHRGRGDERPRPPALYGAHHRIEPVRLRGRLRAGWTSWARSARPRTSWPATRELEAVEPGSSGPCATRGPTASRWPPPTT